jgi:hypothetical protein
MRVKRAGDVAQMVECPPQSTKLYIQALAQPKKFFWGSEKLNYLPKVTQLVSNTAEVVYVYFLVTKLLASITSNRIKYERGLKI